MKSMGRIFIGLVKCGAWGCFDEFNRLEEAVLSAVSMQIQTIQAALKSKLPSTELLGRQACDGELLTLPLAGGEIIKGSCCSSCNEQCNGLTTQTKEKALVNYS